MSQLYIVEAQVDNSSIPRGLYHLYTAIRTSELMDKYNAVVKTVILLKTMVRVLAMMV